MPSSVLAYLSRCILVLDGTVPLITCKVCPAARSSMTKACFFELEIMLGLFGADD